MTRRRAFALAAVVVLGGALAFLALRPSPYLQYVPWMPRAVGVWADSHGIARSFVAFFLLGGFTFWLVGRRFAHVAAVALFATLVEVAQIWIPSRAFDLKDIAASVAGVIAAWPLVWLACRRSA